MSLFKELPHKKLKVKNTFWGQWNEWRNWWKGGQVMSWREKEEDGFQRFSGLVRGDGYIFRKDETPDPDLTEVKYFAVDNNGFLEGLSIYGEYRFDSNKQPNETYFASARAS